LGETLSLILFSHLNSSHLIPHILNPHPSNHKPFKPKILNADPSSNTLSLCHLLLTRGGQKARDPNTEPENPTPNPKNPDPKNPKGISGAMFANQKLLWVNRV
jgi:hypothetical protein